MASMLLFLLLQPVVFYFLADKYGLFDEAISAPYDKNIAVLTIDEMITDPYVNKLIETLEEVRKRKNEFDHVLIVMASGGGAPTGSSELAHYLVDLQKQMNVTLYVESIAASGAYYIASAFKHEDNDSLSGIIAGDNAVVGSIGIYLEAMNYEKGAEKLGIGHRYVTIGKWKVPMSSWQELSEENEQYLKNQLLQPVYNNFVDYVAKGRGMTRDELLTMAEGKVYISTEVVGTLVDRISYLAEIKREIQERVEAANPGDEVGFVGISTKRRKQSLFNVTLHLDSLKIDATGLDSLTTGTDAYGLR
ncbi:S49 family peptidase [Thiomicrolovo sp. ZZH C-3]